LERGETRICRVVEVPNPAEEDAKRQHRERSVLVAERRLPRDKQDEKTCCLTERCSRATEDCLISNVPVASSFRGDQIVVSPNRSG
jgi:hypothetical protein